MSARLFISEELQERFDRDGFVSVPLLSAAEAASLAAAYEPYRAVHEQIGLPYITTSHSSDAALITEVDGVLQQVLAPAIARVMTDYKLLFGNYLVKMPVENSESDPHQDITFVDEDEYASVNIWVALQDTTAANGGMYFLPGSHRYMEVIRPTHHYPWAYEQVKDEIREASVSFDARAGEAFIFHHSVIHGSHPNRSGVVRLAAVMAAYSAAAPLIHYYKPEEAPDTLQVYAMDKPAYLSFEKQKPPRQGVLIDTIPYHPIQLDKAALYTLMHKDKPRTYTDRIADFVRGVFSHG